MGGWKCGLFIVLHHVDKIMGQWVWSLYMIMWLCQDQEEEGKKEEEMTRWIYGLESLHKSKL